MQKWCYNHFMRNQNSAVNPNLIENYFAKNFLAQLPINALEFRRESDEVHKTSISLGFGEACILQSLVKLQANSIARKWIEIGTLTGFSGYCLSQSLPRGSELYTFELSDDYADRAQMNFNKFKSEDVKIEIVRGDAELLLSTIVTKGPFDGIFIDGNKGAYKKYLDWGSQNIKSGGLIIADNVFLGGAIFEGPSEKTRWSKTVIENMQEFLGTLFDPQKYSSSLIPTVEGLAVGIKK